MSAVVKYLIAYSVWISLVLCASVNAAVSTCYQCGMEMDDCHNNFATLMTECNSTACYKITATAPGNLIRSATAYANEGFNSCYTVIHGC
jgi:hypothetical protein